MCHSLEQRRLLVYSKMILGKFPGPQSYSAPTLQQLPNWEAWFPFPILWLLEKAQLGFQGKGHVLWACQKVSRLIKRWANRVLCPGSVCSPEACYPKVFKPETWWLPAKPPQSTLRRPYWLHTVTLACCCPGSEMSPRTSGQEDLPNSLLAYLNILVWILGTESLITIREHRVVPHPGQAHSWGHQDKIGVSWCEGTRL